jgi:hypothetical protein
VSESSSVFESIKDESMELSRWVEVFDYITNAHNHGETEDYGTVRRLREVVPNATPKKRSKVDIVSPPEVLEFSQESEGTDWLLSWHRQMKVWMKQTTENLQEIDASMFRMQSALGTSVALDGSLVPTAWEGIRTAHEAARSTGAEATMARATAGRALAMATSVENGDHRFLQDIKRDLQALKFTALTQSHVDLIMGALNDELTKSFEGVTKNIHRLERRIPTGQGSAFSNLSPSVSAPNPTQVHSGSALEALKKTLMLEISNVSARIDAAAYSVRGRWFRTLEDCI